MTRRPFAGAAQGPWRRRIGPPLTVTGSYPRGGARGSAAITTACGWPIAVLACVLSLHGCASPESQRPDVRALPDQQACRPTKDPASPILWSCRIAPGDPADVHELSAIYFDRTSGTFWAAGDDTRREPDDPARLLQFGLSSPPALALRSTRLVRRPPPDGRGIAPIWQIEALAPALESGSMAGDFFVASERDTWSPLLASQVYRCSAGGTCTVAFALPREFESSATSELSTGIDENLGMEGLSASPDGTRLFAALERPLRQETPAAGERGRIRLLELQPAARGSAEAPRPGVLRQYVYELDDLPRGVTAASGAPGVSEVLAVSNTELLVLERSYSAGCGNTIRLYQVTLDAGLALPAGRPVREAAPLRKRLLVDLTDHKGAFDDPKLSKLLENFEGMSFGPDLTDGTPSILLVSDDNVRSDQITALVAMRYASLPTEAARRWRDGDRPVCPDGSL